MELEGELTEVIYRNDINTYTIAKLQTEETEQTIVGYLPFIKVGDFLKIVGKVVEHPEYGEQIKIETFEKVMPKSLNALEKYLANGSIKGVGPATAKKIVETFGEETIAVMKLEPHRLACIKGIPLQKAEEIANAFVENWEVWQIVGYLDQYGIGPQSAEKIYKKLGMHAIEEIEANPYILMEMGIKVDFKQIDVIALRKGMEKDHYARIASGIQYAILCATNQGHCTVQYERLVEYVKKLLGVSEESIEEAILELVAKEKLAIEDRAEQGEWVYLASFAQAEKSIVSNLYRLMGSRGQAHIAHMEEELAMYERQNQITFSKEQRDALLCMNEENVCIITGGPGTGKTTIIKAIIEIYKQHGKKPVLCAPTGRAAKRMTETTGEEAKTLHRLLELKNIEMIEEAKKSVETDIAPIDADIIIVDEVSMVDTFLMHYLLKATYMGTKLVLVGDADQLPSVGPGNVLKDCILSEQIPTIALSKIFRQAAQSKIIVNAHKVNEGEPFITGEEAKGLQEDFFFIGENSKEKILENIVSLSNGRLKNYGNYDFFKNIQIITPTRKGELGTKELNRLLQRVLNPEKEGKQEKKSGDTIFRVGDRIMQIRNNYDIFWEKQTPEYETGSGVFNGELGYIIGIEEESKQIKIQFDDEKIVWYAYQDLEQIEHAYAITVHKAQGSEFDVVIMPIFQTAPMLLTRNLLYTAMTRAKKLLIIVGNKNAVQYMIQNEDNKKRNTGILWKMLQAY